MDNMFEDARKNVVDQPISAEQLAAHLTLCSVNDDVSFRVEKDKEIPEGSMTFGVNFECDGQFMEIVMKTSPNNMPPLDNTQFDNLSLQMTNIIRTARMSMPSR